MDGGGGPVGGDQPDQPRYVQLAWTHASMHSAAPCLFRQVGALVGDRRDCSAALPTISMLTHFSVHFATLTGVGTTTIWTVCTSSSRVEEDILVATVDE